MLRLSRARDTWHSCTFRRQTARPLARPGPPSLARTQL